MNGHGSTMLLVIYNKNKNSLKQWIDVPVAYVEITGYNKWYNIKLYISLLFQKLNYNSSWLPAEVDSTYKSNVGTKYILILWQFSIKHNAHMIVNIYSSYRISERKKQFSK